MKTNLCPESESVSAQKKRELMEDLVKGHEAATELRLLLQNPFGTQPSLSSSHHLIAKVLRSFTQALTIINSSPFAPVSGQNGPSVPRSGNRPRSGDCSEKRSKNGGRGRYNRRKSVLTWTELSYNTDDNHAWRKYGQKKILNSEFPRSYFRCSYKHDQGCNATKQVQLEQENPRMYRITYIDLHTCNDIPKVTHKTVDSSTGESSLLHSDRGSNEMDHLISSPNLAMKPEFPRETHTSSDLHDHRLLESSMWLEYWKESEPFNSTIMPLTKASDNSAENAYSCADIQNLDMDFGGVASVLLDSHFHFDEDLFF
ncbi:WRKY transcription factor 29 [Vigna unguiculata]|uniref:WRKY transcription factor 29 n=1 Tax=Vigna unguiculata TaxID=3917 RepID=A0A4D6MJ36_VIGUN|nr:WRKY transcription factor 29 [Vigna unguiculata]